jgi:hypothetical protein
MGSVLFYYNLSQIGKKKIRPKEIKITALVIYPFTHFRQGSQSKTQLPHDYCPLPK